MKKILLCISLLVIISCTVMAQQKMSRVYNRITKQWYSYPAVSIHDLQYVPPESLHVCDSVQTVRWGHPATQSTSYLNDTVTITGLCVVPWNVLNWAQRGFTMLLYDTTADPYPWGGIIVFVAYTDTAQMTIDGFKNIERGDIIQLTGFAYEFPTDNSTYNSATEFQPVPGFAINPSGPKPIPPPVPKKVVDMYRGARGAGGRVQFTTGEPYEFMYVELTKCYYTGSVSTGAGRWVFVMVDNPDSGNQITTYDASRWFTTRPNDIDGYVFRDPASTYKLPAPGAIIDTIRGYLTPVSGTENDRGYRINPVFPGDLVIGDVMPSMSTHRRYPIVGSPDSVGRISVRVWPGTWPIDSVWCFYRLNFAGSYTKVKMTKDPVDTLYKANIPKQSVGTYVNYFIQARDSNGAIVRYASAHPSFGSDTSKGTFFYKVLSGQPTISDIQYTPFINGYGPFLGAKVMTYGIVTADTDHIGKTALTGIGTYAYYIQTSNLPWCGLWVQIPESLLHANGLTILNGDSIIVRGTVGEGYQNSIVTQIYNIDSVAKIVSGRPVPQPIDMGETVRFGGLSANGDPATEPYEGMLLRFTHLTVCRIAPYFSDPTEFNVASGTDTSLDHQMRVRRDGVNSYSNVEGDTASGKIILHEGDKIDTLIGILYYSQNTWKLVPRTDADFYGHYSYSLNNRWNMVSVPRKVTDFADTAIFPIKSGSVMWTYENHQYKQKDTLKNGPGYWAKFDGAKTLYYPGVAIKRDTFEVASGWNMIGSISDSVPVASIVQIPPGIITGSIFGYNNGYVIATSIQPGLGYWSKCTSSGRLILNSGNSWLPKSLNENTELQTMNSVTISDKNGYTQMLYFGPMKDGKFPIGNYSLPPIPPTGGFDARYSSDRMVELYPNIVKSDIEYPIRLTSPAYPLTVTWSIIDQDPSKSFILTDVSSGKSVDKSIGSNQLVAAGSMTIKNAKDNLLILKVGQGDLPKAFALGQNYPNPFNPTTKFVVAVPKVAQVEVVVYDILGRKVKTLLNEEMTAGYHTVEWNGLTDNNISIASGVYFIRMMSDKFNAVQKIMMMK
jgi:hypothetical protein